MLIAAPYTPMKADGSLNPNLIDSYAKKLRSDGLDGVFICGTTGEGILLSVNERKIIAEKWATNTGNDFRLYVHVGSSSYVQSIELAKHAQKIGAYAISAIGPGPIIPNRLEELVDYCKKIAAAAYDLHFYYYHMPALSNVDFSMADFLIKSSEQIPNLKGIKFTDNNLSDLLQCIRLLDHKYEILFGTDEILLAGLAMGTNGAVGSTYNYMAGIYKKIMNSFSFGDLEDARKWQLFALYFMRILNKYNGTLTAGKTILSYWGLDLGPCRIPVRNLTRNEKELFFQELDNMNFFEIVKNHTNSSIITKLYSQFTDLLAD